MKKNYFKLFVSFLIIIILGVNNLKSQTNQYLDFDGVNDWVSAPNASQLIANSTAMSMTGWFFCNSLGYGHGMMGFRTGNQSFYMIELNTGSIECRFINTANVTAEVVAPNYTVIPNLWQHYAWIYDGSSVKLYLNGNLVGSKPASGTINLTTIPFAIGKSPIGSFNFYYNGRIDEVSVWNKALTQSEVQGIMQNQLTGTETGLQLYYKFDQGVPGGNNTSITKLNTEVNGPTYNGDLLGFTLTGATSNFNGTLNSSFQAISFPQIPTKLTTSPPFKLNATSTSGLPVSYNIISGPATLSNDTVTLSGPGTVVIKAIQNGNATFDTASPVVNTFDVVNPIANAPIIDPRNPLPGKVYMPVLSKIQLAAKASINYPSLFSVQELHFKINGVNIPAHDFGNGHYTAWWQPTVYGNQAIEIISTSNMGAVATTIVNVNIVSSAIDTTFQAFGGVLINSSSPASIEVDGQLPSYVGAFDTIIAKLIVTCPTGGCGEWDRVASVDAKSPEGNWFEIIRYITPYGTACTHKINLADYMSILQGKVTFRVNCGTLDNGYNYALTFEYRQGPPAHNYSMITKIWKASYPFGDYTNTQPVNVYNYTFPSGSVAAKLKLVSTGHGWGSLNTANAAEFYDATHKILVNNVNTFTQHNWTNCNPNPDNCMPQNGTWQYNRAGWCPGSIAKPFDYDMTSFIPTNNVALKYVFFEQYMDQCHPHNPNCVTGTTCTDCNDGFNPYLDVNCNLVTFYDNPPPIVSVEEINESFGLAIYPNPSNGVFNLTANIKRIQNCNVFIYNIMGDEIKKFNWNGENVNIDLKSYPSGIYIVKVSDGYNVEIKKLIIQ